MITPPYRWCVLFLDTDDQAAVVAAVGRLLGAGSKLDVFRVPGFTVDVRPNPDETRGRHFLDWPVLVEVDAGDDVPDRDMVAFVTRLVGHLHASGLRVGAECDFADELPPADRR